MIEVQTTKVEFQEVVMVIDMFHAWRSTLAHMEPFTPIYSCPRKCYLPTLRQSKHTYTTHV